MVSAEPSRSFDRKARGSTVWRICTVRCMNVFRVLHWCHSRWNPCQLHSAATGQRCCQPITTTTVAMRPSTTFLAVLCIVLALGRAHSARIPDIVGMLLGESLEKSPPPPNFPSSYEVNYKRFCLLFVCCRGRYKHLSAGDVTVLGCICQSCC